MKKGWKSVALSEIAEIGTGNAAPQDDASFRERGVPFFRTSDAGRVRFGEITKAVDCLSDSGLHGMRCFPRGTILVPKSGASTFLNHRVILGVDGCVSSHLATVLADERRVSRRLLLYFLATVFAQDLIQDQGYPSLNREDIAGIRVVLPPLVEQRQILRVLDAAFDRIAATRANVEQNLRNARATFESQRHFALRPHDAGWMERPLSELCDIKHGFSFKGEFFATSGALVLLTAGNFHEAGGYRDRGPKQKYYAGPIPKGFVLSPGDLLVAMTEQAAGLLGSPLIIPKSGRFLHNQRLGLVSRKSGVPWVNQYFFHVFNLRHVRDAIHTSSSGVKVRHTSPTKIGEVVVAFPLAVKEQRHIAASLDKLQAESLRLASVYERKLAALARIIRESLKDEGLLHRRIALPDDDFTKTRGLALERA